VGRAVRGIVPACILLLAAAAPDPALATIRNDPVQFRVPSPAVRTDAGLRLVVEAMPLVAGTLRVREVTVAGAAVGMGEPLAASKRAAREPATFTLEGVRPDGSAPVLIAYELDGRPHVAAIPLGGLDEHGGERIRAMQQRPGTGDRALPAFESPDAAGSGAPRAPRPAGVQAVPGERDISMSGRVQWLRNVPEVGDRTVMPAEGVTVRVFDEDGLVDTPLAQATTDRHGNWSVAFHWRPLNPFDPDPDVYLTYTADNGQASVANPLGLLPYVWYSGMLQDFTGTSFNWGDWWPGEADSPILGILTNLLRGRRWYQDKVGVTIPAIRAIYPEPLSEVVGSGTWYNALEQTMHVAPLHASREETHLHELGHHFVAHFASSLPPDYCNGVCDDPADLPVHGPWECGHCMWCSETDHDAWAEGFPNFIAHVQTQSFASEYGVAALFTRNVETLGACGALGSQFAWTTEGNFTAFLQDLWDAVNPAEPSSGGGGYSDELGLGHDEIFAVAMQDGPTNTREFVDAFRARYPQHDPGVFALLRINNFQPEDNTPCPAPASLTSSSHAVGVPSTNREVIFSWTMPVDDFSGPRWSFATLNTTARMPGSPGWGFEYSTGGTQDTIVAPGAGTYWVNLSYEDREGNEATAFVSYGPIVIADPTPADLEPFQRADWAWPLVPRPLNDVSAAAPAPTILKGDSTTYWNLAYQNSGMQATSGGFLVGFDMDGRPKASTSRTALGAGTSTFATNRATTIAAGRHVLEAVVDAGGAVSESDEDDNRWAHQWAWTPPVMPANTVGFRDPPGDPLGGWSGVGDGSLQGYNCDGLRFDATGWWNAVWVSPNVTGDLDVRLHHAASGVDTGFVVARAGSFHPVGRLEAVIVNRNVRPGGPYDVSVINVNLDNVPYSYSHVTSSTVTFGDSLAASFPAGERMVLREVWVPATAVGLASITVMHAPGTGPLRFAWLDRTAGYAGLSGQLNSAITDSTTGRGHLGVSTTGAGYHAVAVWRDPGTNTDTLTFVLDVEPRLPDPAAEAPALWAAPVVPRPLPDVTPSSVPRPDSLIGWSASTYLNAALRNPSAAIAPPFYGLVSVDGVGISLYGWGPVAGNGDARSVGTVPVTVRGGRHTLSARLDYFGGLEELSEANNVFGEQYVWSPLALPPDASTLRSYRPPDPFGGFAELTQPEAFWMNCDGYRTPTFSASGGNGWWGAVSLTPLPGGDADLRLHEKSTGPKQGFEATRVGSGWGPAQTDYVLVNFNRTPFRGFDLGVVRGLTPCDSYALEPVSSVYRGGGESTIGPLTLAGTRALHLHEYFLQPGTYWVWLDNRSGGADLGLAAHPGDSAFHAKSGAAALAWMNPAGEDEQLTFVVPQAGYVCLAVWKARSADHALAGEYTLQLRRLVADAEPSTAGATALASAWPNPSASAARIAFDLARPEAVWLEVYDVTGARVRTLARGAHAAGRHTVNWDGRDDAGRPVRGGVYFVRLRAGAYEGRLKLARLE
jgi:hypothetical protein